MGPLGRVTMILVGFGCAAPAADRPLAPESDVLRLGTLPEIHVAEGGLTWNDHGVWVAEVRLIVHNPHTRAMYVGELFRFRDQRDRIYPNSVKGRVPYFQELAVDETVSLDFLLVGQSGALGDGEPPQDLRVDYGYAGGLSSPVTTKLSMRPALPTLPTTGAVVSFGAVKPFFHQPLAAFGNHRDEWIWVSSIDLTVANPMPNPVEFVPQFKVDGGNASYGGPTRIVGGATETTVLELQFPDSPRPPDRIQVSWTPTGPGEPVIADLAVPPQ